MATPLTLGCSPCPNDTFIFYALVHGLIDVGGLGLANPELADVEQLNQWALAGRLDVTKLSFHALGHVLDQYCVLAAGSALGRGCGPLLVARPGLPLSDLAGQTIAIPGQLTTAALLYRLFQPEAGTMVEIRFDRIIDAVASGRVGAGVIIHESRFTYREKGLVCLQDLGQWWEQASGLPIPLGCIAARRSLGEATITTVSNAIRASVEYAFAHSAQCLPYIRRHSQELEPAVVQSHIDLYVNDFSKDLGIEGLAAITAFLQRGRETGALPACDQAIFIP